jgi:hypothetical protein
MDIVQYGDDCPSSFDGKHSFKIKHYGLHCQKCYLVVSSQEDLYNYVMVHIVNENNIDR